MNKGQNVRRGRTRHTPNKGGGSSNNGTGNRVDSKSRGNPQQNLDKYLSMARDALQKKTAEGQEELDKGQRYAASRAQELNQQKGLNQQKRRISQQALLITLRYRRAVPLNWQISVLKRPRNKMKQLTMRSTGRFEEP